MNQLRHSVKLGLSQALSSATNFIAGYAAAFSVEEPTEFASFATAFLLYVLALGVQRSLVLERSLVSSVSSEDAPESVRQALASCLPVGVVLGAVVLAGGLLVPGWGVEVIIVGLALPGLLATDAIRVVSMGARRAGVAASVDAVWLTLTALPLAGLATVDRLSPLLAVTAWSVAGVASAIGSALLFAGGTGWKFPSGKAYRPQYLAEFLSDRSLNQLSAFGFQFFGRSTSFAQLRALIQVPLGPLNSFVPAIQYLLLAEIPRLREQGRSRLAWWMWLIGPAGLVAYAACLLFVPQLYSLLVPDSLGITRELVVLGLAWRLVSVLTATLSVQLRVQARDRATARGRLFGFLAAVAVIPMMGRLDLSTYLVLLTAANGVVLLVMALPPKSSQGMDRP